MCGSDGCLHTKKVWQVSFFSTDKVYKDYDYNYYYESLLTLRHSLIPFLLRASQLFLFFFADTQKKLYQSSRRTYCVAWRCTHFSFSRSRFSLREETLTGKEILVKRRDVSGAWEKENFKSFTEVTQGGSWTWLWKGEREKRRRRECNQEMYEIFFERRRKKGFLWFGKSRLSLCMCFWMQAKMFQRNLRDARCIIAFTKKLCHDLFGGKGRRQKSDTLTLAVFSSKEKVYTIFIEYKKTEDFVYSYSSIHMSITVNVKDFKSTERMVYKTTQVKILLSNVCSLMLSASLADWDLGI